MGSKCRDGAGTAVEYSDGAVLEMLCAEWNGDPRNFMEETDCSKEQVEPEYEGDQLNTRIQVSSE
jgi:hypothetical protein